MAENLSVGNCDRGDLNLLEVNLMLGLVERAKVRVAGACSLTFCL